MVAHNSNDRKRRRRSAASHLAPGQWSGRATCRAFRAGAPAPRGCPCPSGAGGQPPFLAPDAGCPILRASEGWGIPLGTPAYLPRPSPQASLWPLAKGLSDVVVPLPFQGWGTFSPSRPRRVPLPLWRWGTTSLSRAGCRVPHPSRQRRVGNPPRPASISAPPVAAGQPLANGQGAKC